MQAKNTYFILIYVLSKEIICINVIKEKQTQKLTFKATLSNTNYGHLGKNKKTHQVKT